ncbi:MAG: hypothetical protein PVH61_42690 [Candidatus Aminicenantes bacterium]
MSSKRQDFVKRWFATLVVVVIIVLLSIWPIEVFGDKCPCDDNVGIRTGDGDDDKKNDDRLLHEEKDSKGNKVQLWCCDYKNNDPAYFLWKVIRADGTTAYVAKCPFEGGYHSREKYDTKGNRVSGNINGEFGRLKWWIDDLGKDDDNDGKPDDREWIYNFKDNKLESWVTHWGKKDKKKYHKDTAPDKPNKIPYGNNRPNEPKYEISKVIRPSIPCYGILLDETTKQIIKRYRDTLNKNLKILYRTRLTVWGGVTSMKLSNFVPGTLDVNPLIYGLGYTPDDSIPLSLNYDVKMGTGIHISYTPPSSFFLQPMFYASYQKVQAEISGEGELIDGIPINISGNLNVQKTSLGFGGRIIGSGNWIFPIFEGRMGISHIAASPVGETILSLDHEHLNVTDYINWDSRLFLSLQAAAGLIWKLYIIHHLELGILGSFEICNIGKSPITGFSLSIGIGYRW